MISNETVEIIGALLAAFTGGGATLSINNRKKHNKLYERVAKLEAKNDANAETLRDIKKDLRYIRQKIDKGSQHE